MAHGAAAVPGIVSYLGPDPATGQLIHVHAHFRLVLGRARGILRHLPIERAVLQSAHLQHQDGFPVPAPEIELLLLALHSALRFGVRAALAGTDPAWLRAQYPHAQALECAADPARMARFAARHLPDLPAPIVHRALRALHPGLPASGRFALHRAVARALRAHTVPRPVPSGVARAMSAAVARLVPRVDEAAARVGRGRKQLTTGGTTIAIAGTDGAGKSSCAHALHDWLGGELLTLHAHLGRPPRRIATYVVGAALKVGRRLDRHHGAAPTTLGAHLELLRVWCTARDRYWLFRRVRAFAARGGIVICERYPLPEEHVLVGPSTVQGLAADAAGPLAAFLRRLEARYYARIVPPDVVIALRVAPATAVRRKRTEPEPYVRARAHLVGSVDWSERGAIVVDAEPPFDEVLRTVRAHVWEAL